MIRIKNTEEKISNQNMQELSNGTTLHNGDYRILQKIGQGGFGVTYVASRTSKGENVAIKELFIQGIP